MLALKILLPLILLFSGVYSEWSKPRDKSARRRHAILLTTLMVLAAGGNVVLLVSDHKNQTAAVAAAQEQTALAAEARAEAAAARQSLQNLTESVDVVVALMQERYPDLTGEEALDRVAEEIRELSERSADFEDQLTGLKMYRDVAELNVLGDPGTAGSGLRYSSALTRALEGSWDERDGELYRRCDQTSLAKFSAVAGSHPTFPFAHSALANCAFEAGADGWRQHADRALEILRHTTQIAGHHRHHDEVYEQLRSRLEQQQ